MHGSQSKSERHLTMDRPKPPSDAERRELPDHHHNTHRAEVREYREHLAGIPEAPLPRDQIVIYHSDGRVEVNDYS